MTKKEGFTVSTVLPARAADIYKAWLSSAGHRAMTGSPARITAKVGGTFSAWDGYISGRTLALEPPHRIVQAWRTSEFPEASPDSTVEIVLKDVRGGTKVTLKHRGMPEGQRESYRRGWKDFYFEPMREYFGE